MTKNDPREINGWAMYDWANSAFSATVVTTLLGPYLTALAQQAVGENGVVLSLGFLGSVTAKSLFLYAISVSVGLQVFFLPFLGALADYTHLKKQLLAFFCYVGAAATTLLFAVSDGRYMLGAVLLIVANLSFGASIVFYNAFLNDITTEDQRDRVSSKGFAFGYLGGGILLALNLVFVTKAAAIGITTGMAVRISLASAGVWWGGFATITFARLKSRAAAQPLPAGASYVSIGFVQLRDTFRELRRLPSTLRYLIGYMLYNDGIQTVNSAAGTFLSQELFVAKGLEADNSFLLGLILMIQFVAFFGALLFARIAAKIGAKRAILLSLIGWSLIVIYAYGLLQTTTQAWPLGAAIAIVLGGSQALSRSLFSEMIPKGREAAFFGLYEISERGTSWIGPVIFGMVASMANSYRPAILSLIVLFIVGGVILAFTDTGRAIREAGNRLPTEAAGA